MKVIDNIKLTNVHIPKKIIFELYEIDPNPRYVTLKLYLEYNYPMYNTEEQASFIWDHAHDSNDRLLMYLK